ncbi:MAG: hypothetical protein OHK0039_15970 [Bacteroidia bacterium]
MIRFKICCIKDEGELRLAVTAGAAAVGLVSEMPSGPGVIGPEQIAHLSRRVPPGVSAFLLTSRRDARSLIEQQRALGADTLQLVDDPADETVYADLRQALPGVRLVQVIHVRDATSVEVARRAARHADALLLDSGNPGGPVPELGGTGRVHDWSFSRSICEQVRVPVYLAGGLHAGNVAAAIEAVQPFGLDVCSGVRTQDRLDAFKLRAFAEAVRKAAN